MLRCTCSFSPVLNIRSMVPSFFHHTAGAHDGNPVNERSANTARSQEGELTISIIQNAIPKLPSYSPPITPPSTADGQSSRRSEIGNNFSSDLMIPKQGYRFPVLPPPPLMAMEFNIPMNPPSHTQPIAALLSLPPPPPLGFLPHPVLFGTLPVHAQLPPPPFAMDPSGRIMLPQMQDLPSPTSVKIAQGPPLPAEHTRNATIPATSLQSLVPVMDPQTRVTLSPSVPTKSFRNQTSECPTPQRNGIKTIPDAERVVTKSATPLTFREQEDCEPPHTKSPKKKKPSRKPFVRRSPGDLTQPVSASEECSDAIGSQ